MLCFVPQKVGYAGSLSQIITAYLATDIIVAIPLVQRDLFKKLNRVSRLVSRYIKKASILLAIPFVG